MKRIGRAIEALVSGLIVYAVMASCSSKGTPTQAGSTTGTGGLAHGGNGGMGSVMGSGGMMGMGGAGDSGIMDALLDPVPSAEAGQENPQSGTRLKGKFRMGADGSKEYKLWYAESNTGNPLGLGGVRPLWYDSQRQEDCVSGKASDGTTRCLPLSFSTEQIFFTDAQCTSRTVGLPPDGQAGCTTPVPAYVVHMDTSAACAPADGQYPIFYYAIGAHVATPQLFVLSAGVCIPNGNGNATYAYYTVGVPIDPASFVAMTDGVDP